MHRLFHEIRQAAVRPPTARLYWLLIALGVKVAFFYWYLHIPRPFFTHSAVPGSWLLMNGDAMSYIEPVEAFLKGQGFQTDVRLPGYAIVYGFFRMLGLSMAAACNALIASQLLLSAVSVYVLGLCALRLFGTDRAFYWAYFLYLVNTFVAVFDANIFAESFAASCSVFFLYAWLNFEATPNRWWSLLWSGIWLAWSVFLKPAHLPLLAVPIAIWGLRWGRKRMSVRQMLRYGMLFLLPFLAIDSLWMIRNYRVYKEIIPLSKEIWYPAYFSPTNFYLSAIQFCQAYGEDFTYWFPNTGFRWLTGWENNDFQSHFIQQHWYVDEQLSPPPAYIYTKEFNEDSLRQIRELCSRTVAHPIEDTVRRVQMAHEIRSRLNRYTASLRDEHPFIYYVWGPCRSAYHFLAGTRGYHFFDDVVASVGVRTLLRIYYYIFVLIPGLVGLVTLLWRGWYKNDRLLLIPLSVACCVITYAVLVRHAETRYLIPYYPFLVMAAVAFFLNVTKLLNTSTRTHDLPVGRSTYL